MDNLPKNGSMTFDKFTCTKTALGGHFQLTSQIPSFNTWLTTTAERHCSEKGHAEGGYEYRPLVRGYSIFNVFSIIVIMS